MDGDVTYADLHFPLSEGGQRAKRADTTPDVKTELCKERPAARSSIWEWCTLILGILCLLLIAVSIALGLMLLEKMESAAESTAQNTEYAQDLNRTREDLTNTMEVLQRWRAHAGLHWYCPEGWTLVNKKCFYKSAEKANWDTSLMDCVARGAFLAAPHITGLEFFSNISEPFWAGILYINRDFIGYNATDFIYTPGRRALREFSIRNLGSSCITYTIGQGRAWKYCDYDSHWICEKDALMIRLDEDHPPPALSSPDSKYTIMNRTSAASRETMSSPV